MLRRAAKEIQKLPSKDQKRVLTAIVALGKDPFQGKQLQGDFEGAWAIRVWPYRIVYAIERNIVTITILRVGHRKDIYRT